MARLRAAVFGPAVAALLDHPLVPHGMSVILHTPAVVRFTAPASPERHLRAAAALGADISDAAPDDAGEVLADRIIALMRALQMPSGLAEIGYQESDIPTLVQLALLAAARRSSHSRTSLLASLRSISRLAGSLSNIRCDCQERGYVVVRRTRRVKQGRGGNIVAALIFAARAGSAREGS